MLSPAKVYGMNNMSDSATWNQASTAKFASKPVAQKPQTARDAAKPAAKRPSWKDTFAFPAYSGLLEIV